jgi:opacity protein-like surface antigen
MKKVLGLVIAISCLSTAAQAEDVSYELKGVKDGIDYSLSVSYDTNSSSITNNPWSGWSDVLTIPDATVTVEYGGKTYSSTGATISAGGNSWNKMLKVENIPSYSGEVNQISFQVHANSNSPIMLPLDSTTADNSPFYDASFYLYLNAINVYTNYYEHVDPVNSQFSKTSGGSNDVCPTVKEAIQELSQLCPGQYSCPMHVKAQLTNTISNLSATCP